MLQGQIARFGVRCDQQFPSVSHHLIVYKMRVVRAVCVGGKLGSIKKSLCTLCILARKEGGMRFSGVHGAKV